ncbi:aminotransferase class I/II-fold pyridoxal phosphate-dependent enzyme, partial [Rhizobium sp. SIMBA_035]
EHDLWLVSDEVYGDLLYEGQHLSPGGLPRMGGRTATINSLSKSHAMSGWRVGWVIAPPVLAGHLSNLALCMLYGLPDFIQNAAVVALTREL